MIQHHYHLHLCHHDFIFSLFLRIMYVGWHSDALGIGWFVVWKNIDTYCGTITSTLQNNWIDEIASL